MSVSRPSERAEERCSIAKAPKRLTDMFYGAALLRLAHEVITDSFELTIRSEHFC